MAIKEAPLAIDAPINESASAMPLTRSLKDSPQRWWMAVLLNLGLLVCYMHRSALSVAAPSMITELGLSMAATGVLLSAFFWPYSILQMPAGWVVDRYGVRKTYALGFLLGSLATAATGLANGMAALIGVRTLIGVGQSAVFPASSRATANSFPDRERGIATSLFLAGNRLGQALINGVGPMLLVAVGWQLFFAGLGFLPLVFLIPWLLFLRRWERPADAGGQGLGKNEFSFLQSLALLRQPTVLGIFLGFFAYDYVWFLYLNWLPTYLRIERKCTPTEMAIFSAVPYIVGLVITLLAGALSDVLVRRGYNEIRVRKSLIIIGLVVACLIVPAGLVEEKMTAVWLLTLSLCGLNMAAPNAWSLTQASSDKQIVGTVAGIQNFGGNIGGVLAPALTGFIADRTHSFALALGLAGVILVGGVFSYWFLIGEKVKLAPGPAA